MMASLFFADDKIKQEEASRASSPHLISTNEKEEEHGGFVPAAPPTTISEERIDDEPDLEIKRSRSLTAGETTFAGDVILDAPVITAVTSSHRRQDQPAVADATTGFGLDGKSYNSIASSGVQMLFKRSQDFFQWFGL
jgi:hypothetical protein